MENRSMFVGLDVHKETLDVSIAESQRYGEVRHDGVIASDLEPLDKVVRALRAPDRRLHFVYEAGPCGFGETVRCSLGCIAPANSARSTFRMRPTKRCATWSARAKMP